MWSRSSAARLMWRGVVGVGAGLFVAAGYLENQGTGRSACAGQFGRVPATSSTSSLLRRASRAQMRANSAAKGGARTDIVCGYLYSEDPLFDPRMGALPPLFVVTPPDGAARQWAQASIDYALQQIEPAPAGGLMGPPPRLLRATRPRGAAPSPDQRTGS